MQIIVITPSKERSADVLSILRDGSDQDVVVMESLDGELFDRLSRDSLVVLDHQDTDAIQDFLTVVQERYRYHDHAFMVLSTTESARETAGRLPPITDVIPRPLDAEDFRDTVRRLTRPFGEPVRVDVQYVNPFIRATANAVQTLTGMSLTRKDLFVKRDYRMFGDISGVMGLTGEASGAVVLSFPEDVAVKVVGRMINRELNAGIDHIVRDGVGEFVNVIAGNAKAALANTQYHFNITLPSVVTGAGHVITHRLGTPCVVVVFDVEGGDAALQVCLAPSDEGRKQRQE